MRRELCCLFLGLLWAQSAAADLVVRDLLLGVEAEPTEIEWTAERDDQRLSGDDEFATHFGVALAGRWSWTTAGSPWGALLGGGLAVGHGTLDPDGELWWSEGRLQGGVAWTPVQDWVVQGLLTGGAGYSRLELAGSPVFGSLSASAPHVLGGAEVLVAWSPAQRLRLWGSAGWRYSHTVFPAGDADLDWRQSGPVFALGIGWGLSESAGSLE